MTSGTRLRLRRGPTARALVAAVALVAAACVPVSGPGIGPAGLFSDGLAIASGSGGGLVVVPARSDATFVVGSRVLAAGGATSALSPTASAAAAADRRWLAAGTVPGGRQFGSMNEQALLDLRSLTLPDGAVLAGWTPAWRYVWPRDASFAAAAYAATGHLADAEHVLDYLARIAPADGRWQARYLADGSGRTPDARGVQLDGAGWVLWAAGQYARTGMAMDPARTRAELERWWPMLATSAEAIAGSLGANGLPPVSPDYWERRERSITLGTAVPDLAGLRAAAQLAAATGRAPTSQAWDAAGDRLQAGIVAHFGTDGWHRTRGGAYDAAATFTMAPYLATPLTTPGTLLGAALAATRNPNGGVRPGADWHRDGVSWTPETALFALAYASNGDRASARTLLSWLDAHRTGLGSLPEKVNPDGSPAAVAPLAWTAALVLLTSAEL